MLFQIENKKFNKEFWEETEENLKELKKTKEKINNEAFLKYISILQFCPLNNLMHGWLDEKKIDQSIELYVNIIFPLIEKFKLA